MESLETMKSQGFFIVLTFLFLNDQWMFATVVLASVSKKLFFNFLFNFQYSEFHYFFNQIIRYFFIKLKLN